MSKFPKGVELLPEFCFYDFHIHRMVRNHEDENPYDADSEKS